MVGEVRWEMQSHTSVLRAAQPSLDSKGHTHGTTLLWAAQETLQFKWQLCVCKSFRFAAVTGSSTKQNCEVYKVWKWRNPEKTIMGNMRTPIRAAGQGEQDQDYRNELRQRHSNHQGKCTVSNKWVMLGWQFTLLIYISLHLVLTELFEMQE